jgi:hypothetical protein
METDRTIQVGGRVWFANGANSDWARVSEVRGEVVRLESLDGSTSYGWVDDFLVLTDDEVKEILRSPATRK